MPNTVMLAAPAPQIRARMQAENVARYLATASLTTLAEFAAAFAAECSARGIQVAEPMGLVTARLEYCAEVARA